MIGALGAILGGLATLISPGYDMEKRLEMAKHLTEMSRGMMDTANAGVYPDWEDE